MPRDAFGWQYVRTPDVWLGRRILGLRAGWQAHCKDRALAGLARHRHVAAHHAGELAGDGKTKAGAAETLRGRGIGLGELLEQLCLCSGVMPMPVSQTESSITSRPSAILRACSLTSPSFVNLHALLSRLSRICRSRSGSTVRAPRFSCALV